MDPDDNRNIEDLIVMKYSCLTRVQYILTSDTRSDNFINGLIHEIRIHLTK